MNRRILLALAVLIALSGVVAWRMAGGGRREPDVVSLADDGSTDPSTNVAPVSRATTESVLANSGRDPRPAKGVGSIVARVVRKSDGLPLTGILVRLMGVVPGGGRVDRPLWTDAKGDVRFDDVVAGVTWDLHVQRDPNPPVDRLGVVVQAEETTDLGLIALESLGILDALVLDEAREPIKGAVVSVSFTAATVAELDASPWPLAPELPGGFAKGTTDDRGRLRIEGVPPGPVAVRATSTRHRGRSLRTFVPQEPPRTAFVPFVLLAGRAYAGRVSDARGGKIANALIEFGADGVERFEPKLATRTLEDGTFAIYGCEDIGPFSVRATAEHYAPAIETPDAWKPIVFVLDGGSTLLVRTLDAATRTPLSGARVSAFLGWRDIRDARTRQTLEGRSGIDGIATIEVPVRFSFDLRVVEEGHKTLALRRFLAKVEVTGGEFVGDVDSAVLAGERRELIALLAVGDTLVGSVSEKDDTRYIPIPGALVRLRHGEHKSGEARTDADGRFRFENVFLADRSPVLDVSAVGYYDAERPVIAGRRGEKGPMQTGVQLTRTEPPLSVGGRVVTADGQPVAGARVRVPERDLVTFSAADGTFSFARLARRPDPRIAAPMTFTIRIEKDQLRVTATKVVPKLSDGDSIAFGDVRLVEVAEITGVVMRGRSSDRTQFPLVELVGVLHPNFSIVLDTVVGGEFGDYTFAGLEAGRYRVRARDAKAGGGASVLVERGRTIPSFVEVRVVDAKICAGRLEDSQGKPVEGITVRPDISLPLDALGDASLTEASIVTDETGAFRFRYYGPARLSLSIEADPKAPGRQTSHEFLREGDDNVIRLNNYTRPYPR